MMAGASPRRIGGIFDWWGKKYNPTGELVGDVATGSLVNVHPDVEQTCAASKKTTGQ
jgi:hypothetical protein